MLLVFSLGFSFKALLFLFGINQHCSDILDKCQSNNSSRVQNRLTWFQNQFPSASITALPQTQDFLVVLPQRVV